MTDLLSPVYTAPAERDQAANQAMERYNPQIQALVNQLRTRTSGDPSLMVWSSGLFGGDGGQTWTVTKANADGFSIVRIGNLLLISLWLNGTTVAGTPDPTLTMILPESLTAAEPTVTAVAAIDNGYRIPGAWAFIERDDNRISIQKFDLANWVPSSGQTYIGGTMIVTVN